MLICTEYYYPSWSARGIRGVKCRNPAKRLALVFERTETHWEPVCGVHARRYEQTRPLEDASAVGLPTN
jgi:hypothetical protein